MKELSTQESHTLSKIQNTENSVDLHIRYFTIKLIVTASTKSIKIHLLSEMTQDIETTIVLK